MHIQITWGSEICAIIHFMLNLTKTIVILSSVCLFLFTVQAAGQNMNVAGRIISSSNEPVQGATILVEELGKTVVSNVSGEFTLSLEKGKKYTITVSGLGYGTKSIAGVEAVELLDQTLVVVLDPKITTGEEIVVRSTRKQESTVALLTFQRNNTALASGLAADFIRRTPDKNTGEVLKRVSGASIQDNRFVVVRGLADRYNAAMLNSALLPSSEPDKKAFSFDMFPALLIDNIIINKTATPEFTSEFSGGLVQVNTRDIPTKEVLTVGFGLGYNTQSTFKSFTSNKRNRYDWLGFDDGSRNIPAGFPVSAQEYRALGKDAVGLQQQIELTRSFNGDNYIEQNSTAAPIKTFNITYANSHIMKKGATIGTLFSLNYRNAMLVYNVEKAFYEANGTNVFEFDDVQNRYQTNTGGIANVSWVKGKHKVSFKSLFNQSFEDNYYSRTGYNTNRLNDLHFFSSYLNQRSLYSAQLEGEHSLTAKGIKFKWNGNGGFNWKKQPDLRSALYARRINTTETFELDPDDTRRFYSDLKDYSIGGSGQFIFPMQWGMLKEKQTLKLGGGNLTRVRDFRSRIFRYNITNFNSFVASNAYKPLDRAFQPDNMGTSGFILEEFTNNQDRYFGASMLNNAYAQMDNSFGAFRIIWGLRAENFQQLLTSKDQTGERQVGLTKKWDFLPSINVVTSLFEKQRLRLSASRTVARPEFREIAEFAFFDYEMNYGVKGDPNLRRTSIMNYDLRYEIYPRAGESISVGAFYKDFTDPIEFRLDPASNADSRRYFYQNALSANTLGLELEIRKDLTFLSPTFKDFAFFGNFTYLRSEVVFNDLSAGNKEVSANRPLQGQSPYLVNAGIQYNGSVFNASLLYNRVGDRLTLVGNQEFPNVYERARNLLDLQVSLKVLEKKGQLSLTYADILNNAFYFYENINQGTSFQSGVDRMFNSWKPGSTITLAFTYDFNLSKKR